MTIPLISRSRENKSRSLFQSKGASSKIRRSIHSLCREPSIDVLARYWY